MFFFWKMSQEKSCSKRSLYDDELYDLFEKEKRRKEEEKKEKEQRLLKAIPLPDEASMEIIIRDIHKIIVETGEQGSLEFDLFRVDHVQGICFYPYISDEWLEPVKDWLEGLRCASHQDQSEREILAEYALKGVNQFMDHICAKYNAKHNISRAERREGGFEIYY